MESEIKNVAYNTLCFTVSVTSGYGVLTAGLFRFIMCPPHAASRYFLYIADTKYKKPLLIETTMPLYQKIMSMCFRLLWITSILF